MSDPDPKPRRQVSEGFKEHVRDGTCWVCNRKPDPDHLESRGSGGSDLTCGRLCRLHHQERHRIGNEAFEEKYNINLWRCQNRVLRRWIADHKIMR